MKKIVVIFCLLCVFSCKKNVVSIGKNDVAGTWVLKRITGGFAGINTVPTDDVEIKFETSGNYNFTRNNATTSSGKYTITKAGEPNYYYSETLLNLFSDSGNITYGISLSNDSLFLSEGCCDQFNYTYVNRK